MNPSEVVPRLAPAGNDTRSADQTRQRAVRQRDRGMRRSGRLFAAWAAQEEREGVPLLAGQRGRGVLDRTGRHWAAFSITRQYWLLLVTPASHLCVLAVVPFNPPISPLTCRVASTFARF